MDRPIRSATPRPLARERSGRGGQHAPDIGDLKVEATNDKAARDSDSASWTSPATVAQLDYAVDSATDWQAVLPSDSIADSPDEAV
jgi:hypothetical protein